MTCGMRHIFYKCSKLGAQAVLLQDGEYILREGEELTSTSKFYLVQSGTVECFKQFSVGSLTGIFCSPVLLKMPVLKGFTVAMPDVIPC